MFPYSRNHLRARGPFWSDLVLTTLDISWSWFAVHFHSFTVTFAAHVNGALREEHHILNLVMEGGPENKPST